MKQVVYLQDYKVPIFSVESLFLDIDLYEDHTIVQSEAVYFKNPESTEVPTLEIFGEEQKLLSLELDGRVLTREEYEIEGEILRITNAPEKFTLKITTEIHPEKNTSLEGLYVSGGKFTTQCESQGFRKITYYADRPDVMTVFTTKITADKTKYPVLLSNGNKESSGEVDNNRHFVVWNDPFKKPSYLFALVAGNLQHIEDSFTTMSGRDITLRIYTESHNIHKCHFAMESLKKAMKWDEEKFGREYDLDLFMIVAVDDFNHGAMENKGLNIFNSEVVFATPETATDSDYIYIERVVAHEYFHNWTGDRVTCRDWFQLSLKEGLTVYRDQEFTADMHSRGVKRIEDVRLLRDYQFKEDASPMAHPVRPQSFEEIRNFYTVTVYEKGAEVVRMYETILGKEGFRRGMDLYFERHDGQAVTTEDFLQSMADANTTDFSQFQNWYDIAGTPKVSVESAYDPDTKVYSLSFEQIAPKMTPDAEPLIIPIRYGILDKDGQEIDSGVISLTTKTETHEWEDIETEPIPSLLRGFSAPVILEYDYTKEQLEFLMRYDSDDFNRFEAAQTYALNELLAIIQGKQEGVSKSFVSVFGVLLQDAALDPSLKAEAITLPSEAYLSSSIGEEIDPNTIYVARKGMIEQLATAHETVFEELYQTYHEPKAEYRVFKDDIAKRKLKNTCLRYLSSTCGPELAYAQYLGANNMTDTMAALSCLSHMNAPQRKQALDDFYEKWKDDMNVMNKWFKLQSLSSLDDTLEVIQALETHLLFDITNPNKVRSLYHAFAVGNPVIFHRADGAGYNFVAERVIKLDTINSQVAARLAKSLVDWKKLEPVRSTKLRQALEMIQSTKGLSSDTHEVVSRALR